MKKILVVEDESIVALEIQNRLEKLGYNVVDNVATGEQAIKKAAETKPDLILMDIYLKGEMDGIKAAQHIKKTQNIPIIYLTAYADNETLKRARITQPYAYIVKPFEERELQSNIEIALYKHQTEQQLQNSKNHLENIIEHISEIIFTIDDDNKITTWNNTAEQLTGYTKNEVIGKPIADLSVFPHPKELQNLINNQSHEYKQQITLQTAAEEQKTIQINQITPLHQKQKNFLFIGTDITATIQKLQRFQPANTYLLTQTDNYTRLSSLINHFIHCSYHVLLITRKNKEKTLNIMVNNEFLHTVYLTQHTTNESNQNSITKTQDLINAVKNYCSRYHHLVIILTNIDYFIIQQSFDHFMRNMYKITDLVTETNMMFFLDVNPDILNKQQQALIKQITTFLPEKHINNIVLSQELYSILRFIQQQKTKGAMVTLKGIKKHLNLSYPTIKKRINTLETKRLIHIKKQGRSKTVHISEAGEQLINKS